MKNLLLIVQLLIPLCFLFGQTADLNQLPTNVDVEKVQVPTFTNILDDSLLVKFQRSIDEISTPELNFSNELNSDSLLMSARKQSDIKGQFNIGGEYGLLTGYIDTLNSGPLKVLNSHGDFSAQLIKLPFAISYNLTTFRNPVGVNNYFRVSLDAEKLKQNVVERKRELVGELDSSLNMIEGQQELIKSKLGMGEVLKQKLKREIDQQKVKLDIFESEINSIESKKDETISSIMSQEPTDKLRAESNEYDSDKVDSLKSKYKEARSKYDRALALYDTINGLYEKALGLYNLYSDLQHKLEDKKSLISGYQSKLDNEVPNKYVNQKKTTFLSSVKTMDFGLTYPQSTGLSKNSIPVQGVNLEIQRTNWYLGLSSGVTMNNLMASTDVVQNKLTNSQNLFNQFDYQNIKERGLLNSIKSGYGTKENTHVFLGIRYLTNSVSIPGITISDSLTVPSVGSEIDIRWVPEFSKGTKLDLIYGKTSCPQDITDSVRNSVFGSLFSNSKTNTTLIRLSQEIKKLRTETQMSFRRIDPFADVRSLGILQPDNVRYEFRSNTAISGALQFGVNYRHDENNVANINDTTLELNVYGGQINGSIFSSLNYFGSFNYLTQELRSALPVSKKNNYMLGLGISKEYTLGDLKNNFSVSYNDYLLTDSISTGLFRNISFQNMSKLRFGLNKFYISLFKMQDEQILDNQTLIFGDEYSIQTKRSKITAGFKGSQSLKYGSDWGCKLELTYRLSDYLEWTIKAEKMVLGDFYNYYSKERFDRFPYAIITKLNFILN